MSKVLVLYYSAYGHMEAMAKAVAEGAQETGANVDIKRVPETVPEEIAKAHHFKLSATVNDEIHAPMGGVRDSGWSRTGPESLKEFQDIIWINSHSGQRQYPI